jgi:hypothetical protein
VTTGSDRARHGTSGGVPKSSTGWRSDPFFFDTLGALDDIEIQRHGLSSRHCKERSASIVESSCRTPSWVRRKVGLWAALYDRRGG